MQNLIYVLRTYFKVLLLYNNREISCALINKCSNHFSPLENLLLRDAKEISMTKLTVRQGENSYSWSKISKFQ